MSFNDFNGKGVPLEDKRLTKSGTTNAGEQQYRIWRDSQQVLVPRGQSISTPYQNEHVQVNTGVFSSIGRGYFKAPIVEFRNTIDYRLFDRYWLQTWRWDLPITDPTVDYHTDLALNTVVIKAEIFFKVTNLQLVTYGKFFGDITFHYNKEKQWISETLHFNDYKLNQLVGDFYLICNPDNPLVNDGKLYNSGEFLQDVNLPISMVIENVDLLLGNSKMKLDLKNPEFPVELDTFNFVVVGGGNNG